MWLAGVVWVFVVVCLQGTSSDFIGLDLGSRFVRVASLGEAEQVPLVALNKDGQRSTHSAVFVDPEHQVKYGTDALKFAVTRADKVIFLAKTMLAPKTISLVSTDGGVTKTMNQIQAIECNPSNELWRLPNYWRCNAKQSEYQLISQPHLPVVEVVSSLISQARSLISQPGPHKLAIAVPSHFTVLEREALGRAAALAKFNLPHFVNDNSAVALDYAVKQKFELLNSNRSVLFFNMGATITQATVAQFVGNDDNIQVQIKGMGWDHELGAMSFDAILVDMLVEIFQQTYTQLKRTKEEILSNTRTTARLRHAAEEANKKLGINSRADVSIDPLLDVGGQQYDLEAEIKVEDFNTKCKPLIQRVERVIQQAIAQANIAPRNLHSVEIVGGGSRIQAVQDVVSRTLHKPQLGIHLNAEESVSIGAAIFSSMIHNRLQHQITLQEISPYSITATVVYNSTVRTELRQIVVEAGKPMPSATKIELVYYSPQWRVLLEFDVPGINKAQTSEPITTRKVVLHPGSFVEGYLEHFRATHQSSSIHLKLESKLPLRCTLVVVAESLAKSIPEGCCIDVHPN